MKEKIKNYCLQFLKEIIPVVAGILIALFIDNWNTERKDKAYVKQIYETIDSELKDTKEDITATIPRQKSLVDSLDHYSTDKNKTIMEIVMTSKGVYIPQVKVNAWKSVSTSKIDLIDYKKITILSNITELKQTLNSKTDLLGTFLYSNINETDKSKKQTLKMLLMDILQTENSISKSIEEYEKK